MDINEQDLQIVDNLEADTAASEVAGAAIVEATTVEDAEIIVQSPGEEPTADAAIEAADESDLGAVAEVDDKAAAQAEADEPALAEVAADESEQADSEPVVD